VLRVYTDCKDFKVLKVHHRQAVYKVRKVIKVSMDVKDPQVLKVSKGMRVSKVLKEI
jgi:hypothetical protein